MNDFDKHRLNDRDGLRWVHRFGWLRTTELGALLWHMTSPDSATRQANRLARSWVKRGLVLARELPENAGRALVLSAAGVRVLAEHGIEAHTGKDIGKLVSDNDDNWHPPLKWKTKWIAPLSWKHDLLAAGVLVDLHRRGYEVLPEAHIRRHAGLLAKVPDGLARKEGIILWIEVESARKTGKAMRDLADALCIVAAREAAPVLGLRTTHALVAYQDDAVDERGHTLSHRARVRAAVATLAKRDTPLMWAACKLRGTAGVAEVKYEEDLVPADRAAAIMKRMEWRQHPEEDGVLVASYGDRLGYVWQYDDDHWSYQVNDRPAGFAKTQEAAKRACAGEIASL